MNTFEKALEHRARGWSVIPLKPGSKHPAVQWKQYQDEIASEELIAGWFQNNPAHNIGIVTGRVSNLLVIDVDHNRGGDTYGWPTESVRTPRGMHYYFHPEEYVSSYGSTCGIDIRCESGYVVAPPSISQDGKEYLWRESDVGISSIKTEEFSLIAPRNSSAVG